MGMRWVLVIAISVMVLSSMFGVLVETISAIAGQTNLLALNAAIEAACAGKVVVLLL